MIVHVRRRSVWASALVALALLATACGESGDSSATLLTSEQAQMLEVLEQHFVDRNNGDLEAIVAVHSDGAMITLRQTSWNAAWKGGVDDYVAWLASYVGEGSGITWRLDQTLFAQNYVALTFWEEKTTGRSLRWFAIIEFDLASMTFASTEGFVTGVADF